MTPISIDPEIMSGTPCFTGTRVPVRTIIDYLAYGLPVEKFLRQFPTVDREQALAVLEIARELRTSAPVG